MSLLDFIRWRVGVGELNRRQVDWIPLKYPPSLNIQYSVEENMKI